MADPRERAAEPRLLDAVDYPIDKATLLRRAEVIDAPDALRGAIARLPARTFTSRNDLTAAVESITGR